MSRSELAWKTMIGSERRLSSVCTVLFITHCTQNFEDDSYNGHCCKTVNFIQASSLNHCETVKLLREIKSEHCQIINHTHVRWYSQGYVLKKFSDILR
jgi:hypothetical protein